MKFTHFYFLYLIILIKGHNDRRRSDSCWQSDRWSFCIPSNARFQKINHRFHSAALLVAQGSQKKQTSYNFMIVPWNVKKKKNITVYFPHFRADRKAVIRCAGLAWRPLNAKKRRTVGIVIRFPPAPVYRSSAETLHCSKMCRRGKNKAKQDLRAHVTRKSLEINVFWKSRWNKITSHSKLVQIKKKKETKKNIVTITEI